MKHLGQPLACEVQAAAEHAVHGEKIELQGGDHTVVALTASHRPEQVRLALGAHASQLAVGGDDIKTVHVVSGVSLAAAKRGAVPPAEGVADDTDVRR